MRRSRPSTSRLLATVVALLTVGPPHESGGPGWQRVAHSYWLRRGPFGPCALAPHRAICSRAEVALRITILIMSLSFVPIAFVMWGYPNGLVYRRYMNLRAAQDQASDHL
jgi:hypothetical protein